MALTKPVTCAPVAGLIGAWLVVLLVVGGSLSPRAQAADPGDPPLCCATHLAGLLPLDDELIAGWCWSGAWLYPVGDPYALDRSARYGAPGFYVSRGIVLRRDGSISHYGVDLCNQRVGETVRAAASGLVVHASQHATNGYGVHVVVAHRLEDGRIAYSVYAHLVPGSVLTKVGEIVGAGQPLGRVGRSGRASTAHLHFEIRIPIDLGERWERTQAIDPLSFVEERLPACGGDTSWARPYLEWAECSDLIARGEAGSQPLARGAWWRMLARAACHTLESLPSDAESLRADLIEAGLLPAVEGLGPEHAIAWDELARDLDCLREAGLRVPAYTADTTEHRALCVRRLGRMSHRDRDLPAPTLRPPTLADACLALAELRAPRPAEPVSLRSR